MCIILPPVLILFYQNNILTRCAEVEIQQCFRVKGESGRFGWGLHIKSAVKEHLALCQRMTRFVCRNFWEPLAGVRTEKHSLLVRALHTAAIPSGNCGSSQLQYFLGLIKGSIRQNLQWILFWTHSVTFLFFFCFISGWKMQIITVIQSFAAPGE